MKKCKLFKFLQPVRAEVKVILYKDTKADVIG